MISARGFLTCEVVRGFTLARIAHGNNIRNYGDRSRERFVTRV
jgi:hypothetical protein